nr:hypothetical protein [Effusibacillus pohliae]
MAFGGKIEQAKKLAAALGYLTLACHDRVEAWLFADKMLSRSQRFTGKQSAYRLFDILQQVEASEPGIDGSLSWLLRGGVPSEPGILVLLSDFLFVDGYQEGLRRLQAGRHQVVVVQVLCRGELDPQFVGDLHLIDSENGIGRDVAISPHMLQRYKQAVAGYTSELQDFCRRRGMFYVLVPAEENLEDVLFRRLPASGVIRG